MTALTAEQAWLRLMDSVVTNGDVIAPRGMETSEILNGSATVDMNYPVIHAPARKLNYKFMAAEAYWILTGDYRVAGISPYNKNIAQFSDDGYEFFGAYGPKVVSQLNYVVEKLYRDNNTRQAVMNIWRENPPATKDYPCTLNLSFLIREHKVHAFVNMRSSDLWLGWPYDVFNFTMITVLITNLLNNYYLDHIGERPLARPLGLGNLHYNAASCHLYERNYNAAVEVLLADTGRPRPGLPRVPEFLLTGPTDVIIKTLKANRDDGGNGLWTIRPNDQT